MRVLLTGGTGLIGKPVAKRILASGWQLRVFAQPGTQSSISTHSRTEIVVGDITDRAIVNTATRGVDVVIHLAGLLPGATPAALDHVNVAGTANLTQACANNGVKRLVFLSSTSVYRDAALPFVRGIDEQAPLREHAVTDVEHYGLSKVIAERQIQFITRLRSVVIRAPIIYGSNEDSWDTRLVGAVRQQPWLTMARLPALPTLQCVHVDDLTDGIVRTASHPAAINQVFNMAGVELFSFRDVGRKGLLEGHEDHAAWGGHGRDLKYDISKAQSRIGYAPKMRLSTRVLARAI